jgi:metal-responsive CopG/Arc/MetJ family transcriptional regulator
MEEHLLKEVTRKARRQGSTRSAWIRKACEEYLRKLEVQELERQYVEGYLRKPEHPAWGRVGAKLAAQVWPKGEW